MQDRAPTEVIQYDMSMAHKMLKAGLDSILEYLEQPPLHDLPNFLGYCGAWARILSHHHDVEGELPVLVFTHGG